MIWHQLMKIDHNFVAVVTGGSTGLGNATVRLLADLGAKVIVADINQKEGEKVAKDIKGAFHHVNVAKEEEVQVLFEKVKQTHGRVDAVINCAGIALGDPVISPLGKSVMPNDKIDLLFKVNVVGSFNVAKHAAKLMSQQAQVNGERGVIVLVSSIYGYDGAPNVSAYSSTKGAVNAMVMPMARDLGRHKIRVMGIAPGFFSTAMTQNYEPAVRDFLTSHIPMEKAREGEPKQFARVAASIIGNPYASGVVWRIDGGCLPPQF